MKIEYEETSTLCRRVESRDSGSRLVAVRWYFRIWDQLICYHHHAPRVARQGEKTSYASRAMEPPIYYKRSEYIETVRIRSLCDWKYRPTALIITGYRKQSLATGHDCWPAEHHPRRENNHCQRCNYPRRPAPDRSWPCRSHLSGSILSDWCRLCHEVSVGPVLCQAYWLTGRPT